MILDTSEMYKYRHADLLDFTSGGSGWVIMTGRRTAQQTAKQLTRHGTRETFVKSKQPKLGEACGSSIMITITLLRHAR